MGKVLSYITAAPVTASFMYMCWSAVVTASFMCVYILYVYVYMCWSVVSRSLQRTGSS